MLKKFEQFNNEKDIDAICEKYGIKNYVIRDDGKVDVMTNVSLFNKDLSKLPLEFGLVKGNFDCFSNKLTTLKGAPDEVEGDFLCSDNILTSLDFSPMKVGSFYDCSFNNILDVKGLLKCDYQFLDIEENPISNIIEDIDDLEHFYMINPLNGNKLSRSLCDEVREDLNLPRFNYDLLHEDIVLVD